MTDTTVRSNAELARAYVEDAMTTGEFVGVLTHQFGRDAVLTAANVLAVLATADAMRPTPVQTVVTGPPLTETGRLVLQRQLDQNRETYLPVHEIQVGDPDPTPRANWDGRRCWRPAPGGGFSCTARAGHNGQHIAGDGTEICAVWA